MPICRLAISSAGKPNELATVNNRGEQDNNRPQNKTVIVALKAVISRMHGSQEGFENSQGF